jgi:hypothetical protein
VTAVTPAVSARSYLHIEEDRLMDLMEMFRQVSMFALLTLMIDTAPLIAAAVYAVWPSEVRLALMRPFSLAGLFAAAAGTLSGFVSILQGMAATADLTGRWSRVFAGASEALVSAVFGLTCLTVAWLLVAVGMWRSVREP